MTSEVIIVRVPVCGVLTENRHRAARRVRADVTAIFLAFTLRNSLATVPCEFVARSVESTGTEANRCLLRLTATSRHAKTIGIRFTVRALANDRATFNKFAIGPFRWRCKSPVRSKIWHVQAFTPSPDVKLKAKRTRPGANFARF